ncbi:MAG: hypothetical protein KAR44_12620 [Candidatus Aegiribacteria sp.]|nr:hypothetical protein [Candidatus Aegiribacteria sp.]
MLDSIPDMFVNIIVQGSIVWTSDYDENVSSNTWPVGLNQFLQNSISFNVIDNDMSDHDFVDEITIPVSELEIGTNTYRMNNGTIISFEVDGVSGSPNRLEEMQITKVYRANFSGTGDRWSCTVEIEADYMGDPATRISLELADASGSPVSWWNGAVSSTFYNQSNADIEFGLDDPVFQVVLGEELLSFYPQPENFNDFNGFAIGVRPSQIILAYDPVLDGLAVIVSPELIEQRRAEMQQAQFTAGIQAVSGIVQVFAPGWGAALGALAEIAN